jgi:DNA polymerase-3 subunit alpha
MKQWIPLNCHTHYSLLNSSNKANQIAERCKNLGYNACAITDQGSVSGVVDVMKSFKKMKKESGYAIKPILGCDLYLCDSKPTIKEEFNRKLSQVYVLAKNLEGWRDLIKIISQSNHPDFFYYKPRISLDELSKFTQKGNLIAISGHLNSDLSNCLFNKENLKLAYSTKLYEIAKSYVESDWKKRGLDMIEKYQSIFGKENFFLASNLIDAKNTPANSISNKIIRYLAKEKGIENQLVAIGNNYYPTQEDAIDQRVLVCSLMETTFKEVKNKIANTDNYLLDCFFKSNNYHIPSTLEMESLHTDVEINNTMRINEMCEEYDILGTPSIPQFKCPNGLSPDDYLRELCVEGWKKTIKPIIKKEEYSKYGDRIKKELDVFKEAGLASYFLIVQDYCNYARSKGCLLSPGRGSGAGCLVSALIGITDKVVDPIKNDLLFERFYNAGRNAPGRVSLPDIDCDFPISFREEILSYIRNTYGMDKVAQMVTFSRMQGRGAVKDVFRAHDACSFEEINKINEFIPQEAEISDELQLMMEETGEASILRWALENRPKELKQWCFIKEDGSLDGQYSKLFEQAIRLEGTKKSQGKHAAGVVISNSVLADVCPMVYDKSTGLMIAGMEMGALEAMGHVKFDILGVAVLDKIMGVQELLLNGTIEGE